MNNQKEKVFADGMIVKLRDTAPDFVKAEVAYKTEDFVKFLRDNDKKGWVNVTIKEARSGKMYAELDTFEPQKKEIQKDPLLQTIDQFQAKVEKNKQFYTNIALGVVALVLLSFFLVRNNQINNSEADTALGIALISIDKGDYTTASFQLENIITDFESTTSASFASFYLAKIKFNNNEMDLAQKYIEKYLGSKSKNAMHEASSKLLADIYFRQNDFLSAIKVIDKSLENCSNLFNCRSLKLRKAFYLIAQDNPEGANKLLLEFEDVKDLDDGQKQKAEELMGRLAG